MRQLSQQFLNALKNGFLSELLAAIQKDRDLDLQIRENYINVYYKGHSLLKLEHKPPAMYAVSMDKEFKRDLPIPLSLFNSDQTVSFVKQIPFLKHNIQHWDRRSVEMEYAQQLIRANNYERSINSDYLILDREYSRERREIDLVGIIADNAVRRGRPTSFCFIELKYGLNQDIAELAHQLDEYHKQVIADPDALAREMQTILQQKQALGLFREGVRLDQISINPDPTQYEFLIILIDYNQESKFLVNAIESLKQLSFASQIKIFQTGLGLWQDQFKPLT